MENHESRDSRVTGTHNSRIKYAVMICGLQEMNLLFGRANFFFSTVSF